MKLVPSSSYYSLHSHSHYSNGDALPTVKQIVQRAVDLRQRAVGLTDHGNIAGSIQLYTECMKHGIRPIPGSELYYVPNIEQYKRDFANSEIKATRYHMGVHALTTEGFHNLVNLSTLTHKNHFHKPHVDAAMFAQLHEEGKLEGLAITTGCYFGYAVQTLINHGREACIRWISTLESWFPDSVYIEVQNHLIDHEGHDDWNDARVAEEMHSIAKELLLPVVLTQDSHYVHEHQRPVHQTLKRLSSWSDTPDDAQFPGDGFHMVDDEWMKAHHTPEIYESGIAGLEHMLSRSTLTIPVLDNYAYKVPDVVDNPAEALSARCWAALAERGITESHGEQLAEELDVINFAEMAGYIMLVAEVTDYIRSQGWLFQVRGSGAGSVVSWVMGITNVDPIHWDLRFERFLSKDRTKPPDYDIDIQHDKRQELIDWMRTRWVVNSIGTWMRLSMSSDEEEEGEGAGSIMRKYYQMAGKMGLPDNWDDIPQELKDELYALDREKSYSGMGKNAAGLVITATREEFDSIVPIHHSTSNPMGVAQFGKDDIEALGFVKLDVLGSKTLTVLARCMEQMGVPIDMYLPVEKKSERMAQKHSGVVYNEVSKGITDGVFQLEGWSTQKGCKDLKPTVVHDLIAAMALFRPATLDSGATQAYIKRKHGQMETPDRHEIINGVVSSTHGIILYQEQVIDVLRALGMEADDLTKFLKAVKASNKDIGDAQKVIDGYMPWILKRCQEEGFDESDIRWLDDSFEAFGGYSFNRAHSTVYGLTAWRCAYLAHYHPLEFYCALLDVASESSDKKAKEKVQRYVQAASKRGVVISRPHINRSAAGYSIDTKLGLIRRGFTSVHRVGLEAARELVRQRPQDGYSTIEQIIETVDSKKVSGGNDYTAQHRRVQRYDERLGKIMAKQAAGKKLTASEQDFLGTQRPREENLEDLNGVIRALLDKGVLNPLLDEEYIPV